MKRALPAVPLVLFIILNACSNGSAIPTVYRIALEQTFTAESWTPIPTSTASWFNSLSVVNTLNASLPEDSFLRNAQDLEYEIGARYDIVDARLMSENNLPNRIFEVEVNCFCNARSRNCCSPERTFAIVMRRMEYYRDSILWMIPGTVAELRVYCMDHDDQVGILSADWSHVLDYLHGRIGAKQFGNRVRSE